MPGITHDVSRSRGSNSSANRTHSRGRKRSRSTSAKRSKSVKRSKRFKSKHRSSSKTMQNAVIQGDIGSQTVSSTTIGKYRPMSKAFKATHFVHNYIYNNYLSIVGTLGGQVVSDLSKSVDMWLWRPSTVGNQIDCFVNANGNSSTPTPIRQSSYLKLISSRMKWTFRNVTNNPQTIKLYDYVLKVDCGDAFPDVNVDWTYSNEYTGRTATVAQAKNNSGALPYFSSRVMCKYKIVRETKITLSAGETHIHYMASYPKYNIKQQKECYQGAGQYGWKGLTMGLFCTMQSSLVSDPLGSSAGVTFGQGKLTYVAELSQTVAWNPNSGTFTGIDNNIPLSLSASGKFMDGEIDEVKIESFLG